MHSVAQLIGQGDVSRSWKPESNGISRCVSGSAAGSFAFRSQKASPRKLFCSETLSSEWAALRCQACDADQLSTQSAELNVPHRWEIDLLETAAFSRKARLFSPPASKEGWKDPEEQISWLYHAYVWLADSHLGLGNL